VSLHAFAGAEIFPELARDEMLTRMRCKERRREGEVVRLPFIVGVEEMTPAGTRYSRVRTSNQRAGLPKRREH
jgi:hypothetical protein